MSCLSVCVSWQCSPCGVPRVAMVTESILLLASVQPMVLSNTLKSPCKQVAGKSIWSHQWISVALRLPQLRVNSLIGLYSKPKCLIAIAQLELFSVNRVLSSFMTRPQELATVHMLLISFWMDEVSRANYSEKEAQTFMYNFVICKYFAIIDYIWG